MILFHKVTRKLCSNLQNHFVTGGLVIFPSARLQYSLPGAMARQKTREKRQTREGKSSEKFLPRPRAYVTVLCKYQMIIIISFSFATVSFPWSILSLPSFIHLSSLNWKDTIGKYDKENSDGGKWWVKLLSNVNAGVDSARRKSWQIKSERELVNWIFPSRLHRGLIQSGTQRIGVNKLSWPELAAQLAVQLCLNCTKCG